MKILMLSWEYPPKNIGGLSTHVYNLSHALQKLGCEVHVITCEEGTAPVEENDEGVYVHRVAPYNIETDDFTKWVMHLNFAMIEEAIRLIRKIGKIDVIHAHDWLSAYCAKVLKWSYKIPLVCTIHATEEGRNNGIRTEMQRYISSAEWMLTYEGLKVMACSNYMKNEIIKTFAVPEEKVWIIPNGVNTKEFDFEFNWLQFRRRYADDDEKIVFFIGRHVFEKGIQLLVNAAPAIVEGYNKVKFIIAGTGSMTEELESRIKNMGLEDKFLFTGYMDNDSRNKLYKVANVAVFPSLYEPFGIVAIEAMIAGCPVVVSDTGGFSEIVEHKVNGMKMINGNADSLKDNVLELFYNEELSKNIRENAKKTVEEKYTWDMAAKLTMRMYDSVREEVKGTEWKFNEETISDKVKRTDEVKETEKEVKVKRTTRKRTSKVASSVKTDKTLETSEQDKKPLDEKNKEEKTAKPKRTYKRKTVNSESEIKKEEAALPKTTARKRTTRKKKEEL